MYRVKAFLLVVLLALLSPPGLAGSPNFILVLADDYGWSSLSSSMDQSRPDAKSDYYRTPHIDLLVNSGVRFSNGYAASPVCSPTRYSIQFGKTPARLHYTRVLGHNGADHNQLAIPQVLKATNPNYRAAHIGKWHIDADPGRYGYDVHDGMTKNKPGDFDQQHKRQWGGYAAEDPKLVYSLTQRAIAFIRDSVEQQQPFFLQLSHYAVHSNIVYSEESFAAMAKHAPGKLHKNQGYAAMVRDMDLSIGVLLKAYESLGLADNTYIIFASDNGGMPVLPMQVNKGKPYKAGLNSPLLRGKWDLTEGGIRVPFAVMGPGIAAGSQSDTPVVTYDLLPTIADLAGAAEHLPEDIDGGSFKPVLTDSNAGVARTSDSLIFHFPHYNRVGMNEPHSAIRSGDYKLIRFPVSGRSLLFNVKDDIGESRDLSKQQPALVKKLERQLTQYLEAVDAERAEDSNSWQRVGEGGTVRTQFFQRYTPQ